MDQVSMAQGREGKGRRMDMTRNVFNFLVVHQFTIIALDGVTECLHLCVQTNAKRNFVDSLRHDRRKISRPEGPQPNTNLFRKEE